MNRIESTGYNLGWAQGHVDDAQLARERTALAARADRLLAPTPRDPATRRRSLRSHGKQLPWRELKSQGKGLGVRRQRIHPDALLRHEIWLPPLDYQAEAVALFRRLNEHLGLSSRRDDVLVALPASLLNEAFAGLQ